MHRLSKAVAERLKLVSNRNYPQPVHKLGVTMHPMVAYAILRGCFLLRHKLSSEHTLRIAAGWGDVASALYEPVYIFPMQVWHRSDLAEPEDYELLEWASLDIALADLLTPEIIDDLVTR